MTKESEKLDPPLRLTVRDLILINNALNEVINGPSAIDESEFPLRIGATIVETKELLSRVEKALGTTKSRKR
jgi:hypothetical protein